jgi:valyl-tRNA synthetase
MNGADPSLPLDEATLSTADRWILTRLDEVTAEVDAYYEAFEFGRVCDALFHFAWDELFDWYVELAKVPLRGDAADADRTRAVLGRCLDTVLRLLHPVIPFVSDELWRTLSGLTETGETVALAAWPAETGRRDPAAVTELTRLQELVAELRRFRTQQGIPSRRKLGALVLAGDAPSRAFAETWSPQLASLADLTLEVGESAPDGWEILTAGGMSVALDLLGSIDVGAEKARLEKALEAQAKEIKQTGAKLGNPGFMAKAPESVVADIRARHEAALAEQALLQARLDRLG